MSQFRAPIGIPGQFSVAGAVGGTEVPAAGYLLYQCLAGSAGIGTLQATTTNQGGATPNANPIVLDAMGSLVAAGPGATAIDMWFSGGVAYKLVLQTPLGATVWSMDNLTGVNDPAFASTGSGEFVGASALTITASAAVEGGTVGTAAGDQRAAFQPNKRIQVKDFSGATTFGVVRSATYNAGPNLTTVTITTDQTAAGAFPTLAIGLAISTQVALESPGGASGQAGPGIPSAALTLGFRRYPSDGSVRTGIDLFGPIGSNLLIFQNPPGTTAGISSFNTATGLITWTAPYSDNLRNGEAVQWTGTTAPGNLVKGTTYIYARVNATTGYFLAVPAWWVHEQTPFLPPTTGLAGAGTGGNDGTGGGLAWGAAQGTGSSATGSAATCTPGWVAPPGVARVNAKACGGGGGGGGCVNSGAATGIVGGGGGGGGYCEGPLAVVAGTFYPAAVGTGGAGGASGNNPGQAGTASTFNGLSAPGGGAGVAGAATGSVSAGTAGAAGTGGSRGIPGTVSATGFGDATRSAAYSGGGGSSAMGLGAPSFYEAALASSGLAGLQPGGGGGGGVSTAAIAAEPGGAGAAGEIDVGW